MDKNMAKRALTVGINNYSIIDPSGRSNVTVCVNGARSMYHLLKDSFGFTQVYHLEDLRASRSRILSTLRHLISISEAGDTICFYFTGHGARLRGDLSSADCDLYYESLVPASGAYITDHDLMGLTGDLYPDAVNFTVITDACHSGGMHGSDAASKCLSPIFADDLLNTIANFMTTLIPFGVCSEGTDQFNNNVSNVVTNSGRIDLDPDPNKTLVPVTKATLLSACHFNELAYFNQNGTGSPFFTQSILETVNQSNMEINYHDFIAELQSKVAGKMAVQIHPTHPGITQTPQLFGQRNRMRENFLEGWTQSPQLESESTNTPTAGQSIVCENLPTLIELRTEAIDVAKSEALHWTDNSLVESSTDALSRLQEYYLATIDRTTRDIRRLNQDAQSVANNRASDASSNTQPWSAAFISWCYVKAYSNLNPGVVGWSLRDYAKCLRDNDLFNADRGHFRYVRDALSFPGPVYEQVNHATTQVEVGDWIFATRDGGTHVDIVLELFETRDRANNPIKWALSAGGNITHTAGFRIYSLDVNDKLTTNHASLDRPDNTSLSNTIGLNLSQINSWRGAPNRMRGLVRLV